MSYTIRRPPRQDANGRAAVRAWDHWRHAHRDEIAARDEFYSADQRICPELWHAPETTLMCANDEWEERAMRRIAAAFGLTGEKLDDALREAGDIYFMNMQWETLYEAHP